MNNLLWQLKEICLTTGGVRRLNQVAVDVSSGVTAIMGYSGAGKSSLISVLAGLEKPDSGHVKSALLSGEFPAKAFLRPLYWVPQNGGLWSHLNVRQHLEVMLASKNENSATLADKLMAEFGLSHRVAAVPGELSLGEQSRLAVARCLAANSAVMLMDEPLAHVDSVRRPGYWSVIRRHLQATGASLLFSTHEPDVAMRESDSVICLEQGCVMYSGLTTELYDSPTDSPAAEFLGPVNWFTVEEAAVWFPGVDRGGKNSGHRPEALVLHPDPNGHAEILSFRFCGSYAETVIRHGSTFHEKTIIHRPPGHVHHAGQRVSLRLVK